MSNLFDILLKLCYYVVMIIYIKNRCIDKLDLSLAAERSAMKRKAKDYSLKMLRQAKYHDLANDTDKTNILSLSDESYSRLLAVAQSAFRVLDTRKDSANAVSDKSVFKRLADKLEAEEKLSFDEIRIFNSLAKLS